MALILDRGAHQQNAAPFISVEVKDCPEACLDCADGIAHLVQPHTPKLLDRGDFSCLTNLTLNILAECREIEATQHRCARFRQIDLIVDQEGHEIFAERDLPTLFTLRRDSILECDRTRKDAGIIRHSKQRGCTRWRFDGNGLASEMQANVGWS